MAGQGAGRWVKRIAGALAVLVIAWLLCGIGPFTLMHFLRQPPDEVRAAVEPRLDEIRQLAERTAPRCDEVRDTGLAAQINGTIPASPAAGTALAARPEVLQVDVACMWWTGTPAEGDRSASGNHFLPLHDRANPSAASSEGVWEISEGFFLNEPDATREEEAMWPSMQVEERDTVDVKVTRPLPDGSGYILVTVTLRRT